MAGKRNEKNVLELEKLREEVRASKLQRNLAILSLVGALFTGAIPYAKWAYETFTKAKLVLKLNPGMSRKGVIVQLEGSAGDLRRYPASSIPQGLLLPPGEYRISLFDGGDSLAGTHFVLEPRQQKELALGSPFQGGFHLRARLAQKSIYPSSNLRIVVESSEAGFLWIYEITGGTPQLLLPKDGRGFPLQAGREFFLPDGNFNLISGPKLGKETLLFVATREDDKAIADQFGIRLAKGVFAKAMATPASPEAGVFVLQYSITL